MIKPLLLILLYFFYSDFAQASCPSLLISSANPIWNFNTNAAPTLTFQVSRSKHKDHCSFFVSFSRGGAATYDRKLFQSMHFIGYNLYKTQSPSAPPLKNYPDATSIDEVFTGEFEKNVGPDTQTFTYYPKLVDPVPGPYNNKKFGLYTDSIIVSAYSSSFPPGGGHHGGPPHGGHHHGGHHGGHHATLRGQTTFQYQYTMNKLAYVSLVNTGAGISIPPQSNKTINLGTMYTNQNSTFDMVLLYNAGYSVSFESLYGQRLKHVTASAYVPYTIRVGANTPTLLQAVAVTVITGSGVSASAPVAYPVPITITVGNIGGATQGAYTESITITMTSIE